MELSAECVGDGPADAGLANTRRTDEAQDRSSQTVLDLPHCQVLHNSLLQLLHAVVVHIQLLPSVTITPYVTVHTHVRLSSGVVSVLDSGAEGPGFKSQSRSCRVTVLSKLFTPIVPLFTKQQNW